MCWHFLFLLPEHFWPAHYERGAHHPAEEDALFHREAPLFSAASGASQGQGPLTNQGAAAAAAAAAAAGGGPGSGDRDAAASPPDGLNASVGEKNLCFIIFFFILILPCVSLYPGTGKVLLLSLVLFAVSDRCWLRRAPRQLRFVVPLLASLLSCRRRWRGPRDQVARLL